MSVGFGEKRCNTPKSCRGARVLVADLGNEYYMILYPPVINHGKLENPLEMEIFMGKSSNYMVGFPLQRFDYRRVSWTTGFGSLPTSDSATRDPNKDAQCWSRFGLLWSTSPQTHHTNWNGEIWWMQGSNCLELVTQPATPAQDVITSLQLDKPLGFCFWRGLARHREIFVRSENTHQEGTG